MKNPDSPLAIILGFFHPAAVFIAISMTVYALGLFVVTTIGTFVLNFMTAENAIPIGLLVASVIMLLILRALPNSPAQKGERE